MTFRDSINNVIRTDRPESPTDLIFVVGGVTLIGLVVAAFIRQLAVPHFGEMLVALGGYKGVKVGSDFIKKRSPKNAEPPATGTAGPSPLPPSEVPA